MSLIFHTAGALSLLAYLGLAGANRAEGAELWALWGCAALAWAAVLLALRSTAAAVPPRVIILWALVFQLAGLWGGPVLEDDQHRYLWDGYRFAQEGTPYGAPPAAFFADTSVPDALQPHLDQINYPELATIYGPATELLFLAAYALAPGELWPLQALLVTANLAVMGLLVRAAVAPATLLLYAWNPLVVIQTAFMAHPDILAAGLILAAWLALRNGRRLPAAALLAGACASRAVFVLAVPLLLAGAGMRAAGAWLAVLAFCYLPFFISGGTDLTSLLSFGGQWQFNAGVFALFAAALGAESARWLAAAVIAAAVLMLTLRQLRTAATAPEPAAVLAVLALPLLLGPVVNAWYVVWLLPLAALAGGRVAPALVSAAALLGYGTYFNLGLASVEDFRQPTGLLVLEHGLIWAGVAWGARRAFLQRGAAPRPSVEPYSVPASLPYPSAIP